MKNENVTISSNRLIVSASVKACQLKSLIVFSALANTIKWFFLCPCYILNQKTPSPLVRKER